MKHIRHILLVILCSFSYWLNAQVTFDHANWQVTIEPETLAIKMNYPPMSAVELSKGGETHKVSFLNTDANAASWVWDDGAYQVNARLENDHVIISIQTEKSGALDILYQSDISLGNALILPIAEGHYIPTDNAIWKTFLQSELHQINTTQDLSMPFWTIEHPTFSANWLLINPFNNQIQFDVSEQNELGLTLSHQFTQLVPDQPFVIRLSISEKDPLAGAKQYRQWLIDNKLFERFEDKVTKTPEASKLIGATHLYIWGTDLLATKDVKDWSKFVLQLKNQRGLAGKIVALFDNEAKDALARSGSNPDRYQKRVLVNAFNTSLKTLARQSWQTDEPDLTQLASYYQTLVQQVQETFKGVLTDDQTQWGRGLSLDTINALTDAGLSHLWLGIGDGWEGGLWHPDVISAAVNAGYLIAPYDSYQTALPKGFNPDWTTAHLGEKAYTECAITQVDGSLKAGFQQSGHYTNPACIRPWLEQRITYLQQATGFNSWFLDAYATGMVFDDYSQNHVMTQAKHAKENERSQAWVSESLKLVTGSEDGNSTTNKGILFAHGMQTPVLGWGDEDLTNPDSQYYLGRWYPNDEPSVFFKSAPMKEPFKTVYFNPEFRLPLYQTVFHDSVITSHHWLFDSLKLSNVQDENLLTQLFYNVPALYNISAGTLKQRLPAIAAQDAFFRPLHQRLINQSITNFEWLTEDKLVQKMTFSDGTVLVVNFTDSEFGLNSDEVLPGRSVSAYLIEDGVEMDGGRFVVGKYQ